jgi:hypothetical protein
MIDFTMPGRPTRVPQTWKQGLVQSSPLNRSKGRKPRLLRGQAGRRGQALGKPAGGFRASSASRTPEGQPRAVAEALATLTTPGADSSIKKL